MSVTFGTNTVHTFDNTAAATAGGAATTTPTAAAAQPGGAPTTGFPFTQGATTTTAGAAGGGFNTTTTAPPVAFPGSAAAAGTNTPGGGGGGSVFGATIQQQQPGAPAASLFGAAPAAASGGGSLFGASSAPFGSQSTPGTGFAGFGSAAPAPGAPSGGLFGSAPAAPSGGMFGSSPFGQQQQPSPFGGGGFPQQQQQQQYPPQQQQQQQQQIPAHAAMLAMQDASARNEDAYIKNRMSALFEAYTGIGDGTTTDYEAKSHVFSTIVYSPMTAQQRQVQASLMAVDHGSSAGSLQHQLFMAPKPRQISTSDWHKACINNPDPNNLLPTVLVGAEGLKIRATMQQQIADNMSNRQEPKIRETVEMLLDRQATVKRTLESMKQKHKQQMRRLLNVMKYVEVLRNYNIPLQDAELQALERMAHLLNRNIKQELVPVVNRLSTAAVSSTNELQANAHHQHRHHHLGMLPSAAATRRIPTTVEIPIEHQKQWMKVMKEHRAKLGSLTLDVQKDQRDLALIRDRVLSTETLGRRPPSSGSAANPPTPNTTNYY